MITWLYMKNLSGLGWLDMMRLWLASEFESLQSLSSLNCNNQRLLFCLFSYFFQILCSAPQCSASFDVSFGIYVSHVVSHASPVTNFEFMKHFWFEGEEERKMCDISSVWIKHNKTNVFDLFLYYYYLWYFISITFSICSERMAEWHGWM